MSKGSSTESNSTEGPGVAVAGEEARARREGQTFLLGLWKVLRLLGLLLLWPCWWLRRWLRAAGVSLPWRLLRRGGGLGVMALLIYGIFLFFPLLWGVWGLEHRARDLARASAGQGQDQMVEALRRAAFRQGFCHPHPGPEAFSFEFQSQDGIETCTIRFAFTQELELPFGQQLQVPVKGQAKAAVDPGFRPRTLEERVFGE